MSARDGGPAFPHEHPSHDEHRGMSLRDYFAAAALQGMFAADTSDSAMPSDRKAVAAYAAADRMLAERSKP